MKKYDVAILGGGVSGLTAAYRLSKAGKKIILIEKEKNLGGMLKSVQTKNYSIEEFYHHILPVNQEILNLIKELGLKQKLIWRPASTSFYYGNKFHNLTNPRDLLFFKPLTFLERMRAGFFLIGMKLIKNPKKFGDISAEKFIIRNAGKSAYAKLFRPLLSAKYGKSLNKISAAWFIDRINIRNKRGVKGEILGYLEDGFEVLIQKLKKEIISNGGKIISGKSATKIDSKGSQAVSVSVGKKKIYARDFISTISANALVKICKFPEDYRQKLKSLKYQGAICILLGLKKRITNFYWTNLIKESLNVRAIIEHTNFQPFSTYKEHVVYLASYPENSSELWNLDEKELFKNYFKDLQKIADIRNSDVNWYKVIKEKEAGLIYDQSTSRKILPVKTPSQNLYIAGMLNSYPDRNLEQSIILSNKAVNLILKK